MSTHLREAWSQRIAAAEGDPCPRCTGILQPNGEVFHFEGEPLYRGIIVDTEPNFATADPVKLAAAFKEHLGKQVGEHFSRDSHRALQTFGLPGRGRTGFYLAVRGWKCEDRKDVDGGYSYENEVAFKQGAKMRLTQLRVYPDPALRGPDYSKWDNKWNIEALVGYDVVAGDWTGRRAKLAGAKTAGIQVSTGSPLQYDRYRVNERLSVVEGSGYGPGVENAKERMEESYKKWRQAHPGERRLDRYKKPESWVPAGYTYFAENNSVPGTVAFIDLEVAGSAVHIAYMAVRPDHRGQGLARKLIQETYDRHPQATIYWGKMMQPEIGHLYDEFRKTHPDRTTGGRRDF